MYSLPGIDFNALNMFKPCTTSKSFMRSNFINWLIVQIYRWMVLFIHFSRNDRQFRFRWIKGYKPSEHVKLCHYRPANGKLSKWHFSGGPIMARDWMLTGKRPLCRFWKGQHLIEWQS